jgi:16S rRNA (cytosine1402-N4)-methyltransferase
MKAIGKAIKASAEEVDSNPRARSAIMRVAEKLI